MTEQKDKGNMTHGNVASQIFIFTLPIMAGMALQQLYNTVDGILVGQFVGQEALAAIGTCAPLTILYLALAVGLSTGSGIIIAQYYGADRREDLKSAASTTVLLLGGLGLLLSVFGSLVAEALLKYALAVPAEELPQAAEYFRIYCIGLVFSFIYNIVAAILRALGDSRATLYFLLISSVMNMVLDYLLIVPCGLGVVGAAIATVIAQTICAIVSVFYLLRRYRWLVPDKGSRLFDSEKCMLALRLGLPTTLQQGVVSCGHIAIQRLVNGFGVDAMSIFTAGGRLESYLVIPALGFCAGMATFTGQNIGAKKLQRAQEGLYKTIAMSLGCCVCLSLIAFFFARPLVGLFGLSGETLDMGTTYLRMVAPSFIIFGAYQALTGFLQGAGDAGFTAFCTLSSLALRVALSYYMVVSWGITLKSIPYAMPFGYGYVLLLALLRYRRGKWKEKAVK